MNYFKEQAIKKFFKKTAAVVGISATFAGILPVYNANQEAKAYQNDNSTFNVEKVNADLEYWGGQEDFLENDFNLFLMDKNKLYNHYNPENPQDIKIGYDSNVPQRYKDQFAYTVQHINDVFDIVNPNYNFSTFDCTEQKDCDIFVTLGNTFKLTQQLTDPNKVVGAYVDWDFDNVNTSQMTKAKIIINETYPFNEPQLRYTLLHEMMHVLFGSHDIDVYASPVFSVYNSMDVEFITRQISYAWESVEDYHNKNVKSLGGPFNTLFSMSDADGEININVYLPLMTREQKLSYVSFLPSDVSTLIALYGDSSKQENKEKYLKLLKDVLAQNKEIFDIDYSKFQQTNSKPYSQPYYEDDYELPEL